MLLLTVMTQEWGGSNIDIACSSSSTSTSMIVGLDARVYCIELPDECKELRFTSMSDVMIRKVESRDGTCNQTKQDDGKEKYDQVCKKC